MKRRSDWHITTSDPNRKIVWIVDEDKGNMSVTNDAERVVQAVLEVFPNYRIVYRDSEGNWNELHHKNGYFTGYGYEEIPPYAQ